MSAPFDQLLDATIEHLQDLKAEGVRFLPVTAETLAGLMSQPVPPAVVTRQIDVPGDDRAEREKGRKGAGEHFPLSPPPPFSPAATRAPAQNDLPAAAPAPPAPALDPQAKAEAMKELRERALVCQKCPHLAGSRQNVVFGVGDIHAALMFVGEAPGADEDVQGEPFVGAAGQLLTRIIQTMGLSRDTVYIANILKCRPDTPGQSSGNRKPTSEEMATCIPYLHSQIDLIQPKVLVALGATAMEGLLNKSGISRLRGQWHSYRGIPLMPTFHPSYLLRNQALSEKRKVWEDMLQVMTRLGLPISEKQRGYFLRA
jgi:DNA polymerase